MEEILTPSTSLVNQLVQPRRSTGRLSVNNASPNTSHVEPGTPQFPMFSRITFTAEKNGSRKSNSCLIFHGSIYHQSVLEHFQYIIRQINKKTVGLVCTNRKCRAKASAKIPPDLVLEIPGARKRGDKVRSIFKLDFSNPRLRQLSSFVFTASNSEPHNHPGEQFEI